LEVEDRKVYLEIGVLGVVMGICLLWVHLQALGSILLVLLVLGLVGLVVLDLSLVTSGLEDLIYLDRVIQIMMSSCLPEREICICNWAVSADEV
jgi:hypothetical protein